MATFGDKTKKDLEIAERRKLVASLLTRRIDQTDIATTIKAQHPEWDVSQPTISRDIKWLKERWLEDSKQAHESFKARELAELDEMERDCALQFGADKKRKVEWIRTRLSVKERRAKLLGLDAPSKIAPTDPTGQKEYTDASNSTALAELRSRLDSLFDKGGTGTAS